MRTRPLGKTGLDVTELTLGTWGLSGDGYGAVVAADQEKTIERAVTLGINLFDTAGTYGKGEMEKLLGRLVPKESFICTKLGTDIDQKPPRKRFDTTFLRESFEKAQERLARETIDIVLLHNPTMLAMGSTEALDFLGALKEKKLIRAFGVSVGNVEVARAAIRHGAEVIEIAYNAFVANDLHTIAGDVSEAEIGVLARSVLSHGLLTGHWSAEREFYPGDHRLERWTPSELKSRIEQLDALRPIVNGPVLTLRAAALRFVLSNNMVSSAVLGPRSVAQLDQLAREAGVGPPYLRDTALAELAARLKRAGVLT